MTPMPSSTIASRPAVTCSPEATTASYSRASCRGAASRHQATSSLVLPAMAETTTATSWPASTSRLTWLRDIADAVDVGDRGSAEFHHQAGHAERVFCTDLGRELCRKPPAKRRVYIPAGSGGCNRARGEGIDGRIGAGAEVRPSTPPRSRGFRGWPPPGGTRAARWALLHKFNPVRLGYHPRQAACRRFDRDPKRLDSLDGAAHPRHRLRRRHPVRAAGAARRRRGGRRSGRGQYRGGAGCTPRRAGSTIDYRVTTAEALADAGERFDVVLAMEVVEHVADVRAVRQALRRDGEARRADDRGDAQPHAQELSRWRSSAPNTCCAGCRAAPISGTSSSRPNELEAAMERSGLTRHRRDRRDLQSHRRPLADLDRHGRELHGHGGEGRPDVRLFLALGVFTLIAAAAQTVRNATQRELTATLGTAGATHVRFLFGVAVRAACFCRRAARERRGAAARRPAIYWPWMLQGAIAQIAATALMLAAMNDRSFVVVYAYIKTEPVQVALFGLMFLGDAVTLPMARRDPDRHGRRGADGAQARRGRLGLGRRCSGSPPAACSRCRRSAIAARS